MAWFFSCLSCKKGDPQEGQNPYVGVNKLANPENFPVGPVGEGRPVPSFRDSVYFPFLHKACSLAHALGHLSPTWSMLGGAHQHASCAVTRYHSLSGLNNGSLSSHSSED